MPLSKEENINEKSSFFSSRAKQNMTGWNLLQPSENPHKSNGYLFELSLYVESVISEVEIDARPSNLLVLNEMRNISDSPNIQSITKGSSIKFSLGNWINHKLACF